ncbi:heparinase II/III domain-containing protein [Gynuella sp.]|uniref:heparinase II/III domain-containing protein n=1 Tax=Gynuella sp. TaxID=2969146 RepID=UPI003D102EF2
MLQTPTISEFADRAGAFAPYPPMADREAWQALNHGPHEHTAARLLALAETFLVEPIPMLRASDYLAYSLDGSRFEYELPQVQRRRMMGALAMAYGLSADDRFLAPLIDVVWAILEESSWCWPAHAPAGLPDVDQPVVDLNAAMTAFELAELDYLLQDTLPLSVRRRILREIQQRCFVPYLEREHEWMFGDARGQVTNWSAVCNGSILSAALYLEPDPVRLTRMFERGLRSLALYIDGFDDEGCLTEGPGYWGYGFGYYTVIADLLARFSDGAIDLLAGEKLHRIAEFPLRCQLSPGQFVSFSDAPETLAFVPGHLHFLARQLGLPGLLTLAEAETREHHADRINWMLRDVLWRTDVSMASMIPERHEWFPHSQWMIHRVGIDQSLVVAVKGGHNGEMHNHNDLGSFIVHCHGRSLLTDPGRGRYLRGYFGAERYDFLVNRSLGHSVPVINGCEQSAGPGYQAVVLVHEVDDLGAVLDLDLTAAYPAAAGLASLVRRLQVIDGPPAMVILTDTVVFKAGITGSVISQLVATVRPEYRPGLIQVGPMQIVFDPELNLSLIEERGLQAQSGPDRDLFRIQVMPPEPLDRIQIRMEMTL